VPWEPPGRWGFGLGTAQAQPQTTPQRTPPPPVYNPNPQRFQNAFPPEQVVLQSPDPRGFASAAPRTPTFDLTTVAGKGPGVAVRANRPGEPLLEVDMRLRGAGSGRASRQDGTATVFDIPRDGSNPRPIGLVEQAFNAFLLVNLCLGVGSPAGSGRRGSPGRCGQFMRRGVNWPARGRGADRAWRGRSPAA
jgi:hypothetical protein